MAARFQKPLGDCTRVLTFADRIVMLCTSDAPMLVKLFAAKNVKVPFTSVVRFKLLASMCVATESRVTITSLSKLPGSPSSLTAVPVSRGYGQR